MKKSIEEIAKDVLAGKWGTGVDRIKNLEEAGYNYNEVQEEANRMLFRYSNVPKREGSKIKNVIFKDPATIVFWSDGTKTVVKCGENDIYDPEKGLAMAISKKAMGNEGNYFNEIKNWLPYEKTCTSGFSYENAKHSNDLDCQSTLNEETLPLMESDISDCRHYDPEED